MVVARKKADLSHHQISAVAADDLPIYVTTIYKKHFCLGKSCNNKGEMPESHAKATSRKESACS